MPRTDHEAIDIRAALRRASQALSGGGGLTALRDIPPDAAARLDALKLSPQQRVMQFLALAGVYHQARDFERAEQSYLRVLKIAEHPQALINLGHLYHFTGRLSAAIDMRRRALACAPQDAGLRRDLACSLIFVGEKREGLDMLRGAAEASADPELVSTYLFRLHHDETLDPRRLYDAHRAWARRFGAEPRRGCPRWSKAGPEKCPLRIGYLSPDFRTHPVSFFFESLLDGHDRDAVELFGYGQVSCPDETTARLIGKFHRYRSIVGLSDQTVADLIEREDIDILVDLAGHTAGNRLGVFALKPAPIQVTYCGYPDTSGLPQMDYRLVDALSTPAHLQRYHTETLAYLPETFLCYRPSEPAASVPTTERTPGAPVTFGVFNNTSKVNDPMIRLWSELLQRNPGSMLLFKSRAGDDLGVQMIFQAKFKAQGIPAERIQFAGQVPQERYYRQLTEVDLVLDTYPYHGTTTTCDALWMGVPVVTRLGSHHASRVGLSLLSQVGMDFCVARSDQDYIDKASALIRDRVSLAKIRRSLRARMAASPLCGPRRFAGHVEAAYREMWTHFCQGDRWRS